MFPQDFNMKLLRAIPLFSSLSDEDLEFMRPALRRQKCGPGEVVVREGDAADRLFVVTNGEVQVIKNYLEPGAQVVDVFGPGAFFGEMALFGEENSRSATVVTTEECRFITLDREAFHALIVQHPPIALALVKEAFRRVRQANELIASLQSSQPVEE